MTVVRFKIFAFIAFLALALMLAFTKRGEERFPC
jgi:hypothetical protein